MKLMIACRAIDNMAGGVERQAIALANEMAARGHDVSLFTLDNENATAFYDIAKDVHFYKLGIGDPKQKASLKTRLQRMKKTRGIIKEFKPDSILAFQDGMFITLLLYLMGLQIPIIAAERETPYRYDFVKYRTPQWLVFLLFRFASAVTVQCPSYVKAYPKNLQSKIAVIPNSVYPAVGHNESTKKAARKIILCVGRLTYQKNQLALLEAFITISPKHPDWIIQFVGDGDRHQEIQEKAMALNLGNKVQFIGAVTNITDYYKQADFLCIPSYWEGFPNVLGEALAHGLPAVGYAECGGVCDLIHHGENGLLAKGNGDITSLKNALDQMMTDDKMRESMSQKAVESVTSFTPNIVYDQWENFLKEFKTC